MITTGKKTLIGITVLIVCFIIASLIIFSGCNSQTNQQTPSDTNVASNNQTSVQHTTAEEQKPNPYILSQDVGSLATNADAKMLTAQTYLGNAIDEITAGQSQNATAELAKAQALINESLPIIRQANAKLEEIMKMQMTSTLSQYVQAKKSHYSAALSIAEYHQNIVQVLLADPTISASDTYQSVMTFRNKYAELVKEAKAADDEANNIVKVHPEIIR